MMGEGWFMGGAVDGVLESRLLLQKTELFDHFIRVDWRLEDIDDSDELLVVADLDYAQI